MSDNLEAKKIDLELAKVRYAFRATLAATVIGPVLLSLLQWLLARQAAMDQKKEADRIAAAAVAAAADVKKVASEKAEEVKSELTATAKVRDEKLDVLVTGVDANTKSWQAFHSKDPMDMNRANEAITKAEELTTKALPAAQAPPP